MKLSVVIPAYNEEAIIVSTVKTLDTALAAMWEDGIIDDYEMVFVSDGSTDGTVQLVCAVAAQYSTLNFRFYTQNRGKGYAVRTGVAASSGDYVLYTDCDLAYGTDVIRDAVLHLSETGADVLIGSRAIHPDGYAGYTPIRRFASIAYLRFLSVAAGFDHSDSQAGFKAFRGEVGRELFAQCKTDGFAFDLEWLLRAKRAKCSFCELPIKVINHRQSSIHLLRDSMKMLGELRQIKRNLRKEKKTK